MNSTLENISPQTIALLEENAERFGLSVDEYLRSLLPGDGDSILKADAPEAEFEADMKIFAANPENLDYRGNYSREDIYFDHD